jgi:SNF2-related domain
MTKDGVRRPFEQKALVICSFQFAARHADELMVIPWDLVIIDEAHRLRNVYRPDNRIGRTLKGALANVPKVLLTATPLQNSLMELYGLVSLIDDYAFGDAKSFRTQYARLGDGAFDELKGRLKAVCHRTLRRQVVEYVRYTNRIPITQEFVPTEQEQALYDMVSDYLRRPSLQALPSSQRTLMTLIMRKLLASSSFAIAGALDSLARELERQLRDDRNLREKLEEEIAEDYEQFDEVAEEWPEEEETPPLLSDTDIANIQSEIADLSRFRDLAVSISQNAKGQALLSALRVGFAKAIELGSAEKAIIFTESRRTQEYLVRLLSKNEYNGKLVLFNGSNSDDKSKEIYNAWVARHKGIAIRDGCGPSSNEVAVVVKEAVAPLTCQTDIFITECIVLERPHDEFSP